MKTYEAAKKIMGLLEDRLKEDKIILKGLIEQNKEESIKSQQEYNLAHRRFLRYCEPATVDQYSDWVWGYLTEGGNIGDIIPEKMPPTLLILKQPAEITQLHHWKGMRKAPAIIIPKTMDVTYSDLGDLVLFRMEGFEFVSGPESELGVLIFWDTLKTLRIWAQGCKLN